LRSAIFALRTRDNANAIRTSSPRWFGWTLYDARNGLLLFRRFSSLSLVHFSGLGCAELFSLFLDFASGFFLDEALLIFDCAQLRFLAKPDFFDFPLTLFDVFPLARL
jgi:hypothetical protein